MTTPETPQLSLGPSAPTSPGEPSLGASASAAPVAGAGASAPISELFHSASQRRETSWIWIALPVAGLMVVPLGGIVYAMTSSFGRGATAAAGSGAPITDVEGGELDSDLHTPPVGGARKALAKAKRTPGKAKANLPARTDGAAACCAKLEELGKSAPLESRGTYLAASRVCSAADDEETALKQARSAVGAARVDVPEECK